MIKKFITGGWLFCTFLSSVYAQQVVFSCDFEKGIPDTFTCYDEDGNEPSRGMKKYGLEMGKAWVAYTEYDGNGRTNGTAYSGSWYKEPGRSNDWLVTPVISVGSSQTILSWKAHAIDAERPDGYAVYITDMGSKPGDFPAEPEFTVAKEKVNWCEHSISLKKWAGKQIRIAFVNNSVDCNLLALDNIKVFVNEHSFIYISQTPDAISTPGNVKIKGGITSSGFLPVEGYKVILNYGEETFVKDYSQKNIAVGDTAYFEFPQTIPVALDETVDYTLSVSSGEDDQLVDKNSITCFKRVVLAEEGTGTWCVWCPRGQLGMHILREKYPENFIDIAVHMGNDPMFVTEYVSGVAGFFAQGIPHCVMNRHASFVGDPYYNVENLFLEALSEGPIAKVHCTATLVDKGHIEVKAISEFGKPIEKGLYNLAFAIVEDSVAGYEQANGYAGGSEKMGGLEDLPNPIPADKYYFANVARAIYPSYTGDEEAFATMTMPRTEITTVRQYEIPKSVNVPGHLKVVAMIIDAATGTVVNAHECHLEIPDGISSEKIADEPIVMIVKEKDGCLRISTADDNPIQFVELYTWDGKCIKQLSPSRNTSQFYLDWQKEVGIIKVTTAHGVVCRKIRM